MFWKFLSSLLPQAARWLFQFTTSLNLLDEPTDKSHEDVKAVEIASGNDGNNQEETGFFLFAYFLHSQVVFSITTRR